MSCQFALEETSTDLEPIMPFSPVVAAITSGIESKDAQSNPGNDSPNCLFIPNPSCSGLTLLTLRVIAGPNGPLLSSGGTSGDPP